MSIHVQRSRDSGMGPVWWIAGAVVLVIAVLAAIWVLAGTETVLSWFGLGDDAQSEGAESGVNLSEVSDNPDAMFGRVVTVSGGVQEIIAPHAMVIGSDAIIVGDTVLVVGVDDFGATVTEDDAVLVTGEVQRFQLRAAEERLNVDLDDEALADYEGQATIVATQVKVNPPGLGPGDIEHQGPSAGFEVNADTSDITDDLDMYLGETVTVSGEVEQVISPHAFRFGNEKLLAISSSSRNDLFVEPTAYVRGRVREFRLAEIEQETGVDLDDGQFEDAEGEPVIIVEAMELVK